MFAKERREAMQISDAAVSAIRPAVSEPTKGFEMSSITEILFSLTARNGGATVSLEDGSVAAHTSGFYVGGAVPSETFEHNGYITDYATAVSNIMRQVSTGYIGSWIDADAGMVYIDAVDHVEDFDAAVALAKVRGELAIWEIAGGTDFRIS